MSKDLPQGYRWATEDEAELACMGLLPQAIMVKRTHDSQGNRYAQDEADMAVPSNFISQDDTEANVMVALGNESESEPTWMITWED